MWVVSRALISLLARRGLVTSISDFPDSISSCAMTGNIHEISRRREIDMDARAEPGKGACAPLGSAPFALALIASGPALISVASRFLRLSDPGPLAPDFTGVANLYAAGR